jgi:hypothetical protein
MSRTKFMLVCALLALSLILAAGDVAALSPSHYAYGYLIPTEDPNIRFTGVRGILVAPIPTDLTQTTYVAGMIGICSASEAPPCDESGSYVIETGYIYRDFGGTTGYKMRQYVAWTDGQYPTVTNWWYDTTDLTGQHSYRLTLVYDSNDTQWEVYRYACAPYSWYNCPNDQGTLVKTVSTTQGAGGAGLTEGQMYYSGATGQTNSGNPNINSDYVYLDANVSGWSTSYFVDSTVVINATYYRVITDSPSRRVVACGVIGTGGCR